MFPGTLPRLLHTSWLRAQTCYGSAIACPYRETARQRGIISDNKADRQTDTDRQTDGRTDRQTERQTYTYTDRETHRQTD